MDESKNDWEQIKIQQKSRHVDDYSGFAEGDFEPSLQKVIYMLILVDTNFIVFLEDGEHDFAVQWAVTDNYVFPTRQADPDFADGFGLIVNKIGLLEEAGKIVLVKNKVGLVAFQRLLGESMARLLDDQATKNATTIVQQAEEYVNERKRKAIITSAIFTALVFVALAMFTYLTGICHKYDLGICFDKMSPYILAICFGGLGGFLSILQRRSSLEVEATSENIQYYLEGVLRTVYGAMSGLILFLAFKSDLLLANMKAPQYGIIPILLFSIVAGYSERFIPNFITKLEDGIEKPDKP